jgi:hypothetical protein
MGGHSQGLHRDQMTGTRDRHAQAGHHFNQFRAAADLRLDARRRKQQIDDDALVWLARRQQSHGREPA